MSIIRRMLRTADDVAAYRKQKAAMQKFRCPICRGSLASGVTALDHSHKTGHVRSVLCRSCNVGEGKVLAALLFRTTTSNLAYRDPVQWLRNLADYLEHHANNPSGIIHPTFDLTTGKQRPVKRKKK
jgi:hypothetical protein